MEKGGMPVVTVLSVDGGGIRGIIPAMFLEEMEKRTGKPVCALFDVIGGTSTGGIIAALLTVPNGRGGPKYTAAEVRRAYEELGRQAFHRSALRTALTLNGLLRPKYSARPLERLLLRYLGSARLHETLTRVLIPAYDMKGCTPWFFKSTYAAGKKGTADDPMLALAARATSAAPAYFPPRSMEGRCFIDGGTFANNPALCAYAEARREFPGEREFLVVSLGTGEHRKSRSCRTTRRWGALAWGIPLFGVMMNSAGATVDYQMKTLEGPEGYCRFQLLLDRKEAEMDDAGEKNIRRLEALARAEIRRDGEALDRLCRALAQRRDIPAARR